MGEQKDMFWGLVVKAGKRYETEVQSPFRLTKACLEPSTAGSKVSSVMVENSDGENYIIANLNQRTFNENLDVAFNEGEKICFKVEGAGTVHLTGNLVPEPDEGFPGMFDEDDSNDEDIAELEDIAKQAQKIKKGIRALPPGGVEEESDGDEESDEESEDGDEEESEKEKEVVKRKLEDSADVPAKKTKKDITEEESEDDSDEEDSDGDDDSEDEDDEDDDDDELDSIGDLTEEQAKKLELIRKMYETAEGKVNTEVNNAKKKNKPVEDSKKKPVADSKKKPEEAKKAVKGALAGKDVNEKGVKAAKAEVPAVRTLKGGVQIEDQCLGSGAEAKKGNFVGMYYKGWLRGDKKTFDSCMSGKPFRFRLGSGQVIAGWERGVLGMREGGKRRLTLAPNMAYGTRGAPPDIPGNATLVFDIECKYVKLHASQEKL